MGVKTVFGENLKHCRKEKHLSQEQLSEKVDISVKHLSALERGLTFVSADLLEKLANTLEVPVYQFFRKETDTSNNEALLNIIDRKIEKHLIRTIKDLKTDIRQNDNSE